MTDFKNRKVLITGPAIAYGESLRLEFAHDGVPVKTTVVCPFYVATGKFAGVARVFRGCCPSCSRKPSSRAA
jgi:hypothetical protein